MWIERKVEGDRPARMKLENAQPMNARKFGLKFIKHFLWIAVALWNQFSVCRVLLADPGVECLGSDLEARSVETSGCSSTRASLPHGRLHA